MKVVDLDVEVLEKLPHAHVGKIANGRSIVEVEDRVCVRVAAVLLN